MEAKWVRSRNPFAAPRRPKEVADGVWLLGSRRVNFYALTAGRSVTLVDAGFYGHLRYLDEWLAWTGRNRRDVEAIVVTHGHADHLGFAGEFDRRGVPVYVHKDDLDITRTTKVRQPPLRLRRHPLRGFGMLAEALADSVFAQPPVPGARPFTGGEDIPVPVPLKSIAVPGHSPGNCVLLHAMSNLMFTGDTLMTRDPMFGDEGPVVFSEDPANDAICLANLALLAPYATAALLPAHGEPDTSSGALGKAITAARIPVPGRANDR